MRRSEEAASHVARRPGGGLGGKNHQPRQEGDEFDINDITVALHGDSKAEAWGELDFEECAIT